MGTKETIFQVTFYNANGEWSDVADFSNYDDAFSAGEGIGVGEKAELAQVTTDRLVTFKRKEPKVSVKYSY